MRRMFGFALSGICTFISISVLAQGYPEEALIFNRTSPGGSARVQSMGGAQVALGGDYSSAFSNPAGLGFFNRSEATFSLGTNSYSSSSSYLSSTAKDSKSNFNVPGFSLVLHNNRTKGKMVSSNFAITFTRTNNFNQNYTYNGKNNGNSMIDYFVGQSNSYGQPPSQLFYPGDNSNPSGPGYYTYPWLGYQNYLFGPNSEVIPNGDSTQYGTYVNKTPNIQHERIQNSGAQKQLNFAYGANFNDFLYVGAGVGVAFLNYQSNKAYTESYASGPLYNFELDENLHVSGTGVNATVGAILKPKDFIQFGLSISTPTYYPTLTEDYNATMGSNWNNYNYVDITHPSNNITLSGVRDSIYYQSPLLYSLTTPWRFKAGATFFIQKKGLITAEVEKVNFANSKFGSNSNTPADFSGDNAQIKTLFHNVFNFRVGGEYRFGNFRGRVGFNYMPNPYSVSQNNVDNTTTSYTAGIGYRSKKYFVDLGIIQTQWNSSYVPYSRGSVRNADDNLSPIVTIKSSNLSAMITVGYNL